MSDWLPEYAKWRYENVESGWKQVDEKADQLQLYVGGAVSVLTTIAVSNIKDIGPETVGAMLPALICGVAATLCCMKCRNLSAYSTPPKIAVAKSCVKQMGDESEMAFVNDWHEATELLHAQMNAKSAWLSWAYRCAFWAVALLVVPTVVAVGMKL